MGSGVVVSGVVESSGCGGVGSVVVSGVVESSGCGGVGSVVVSGVVESSGCGATPISSLYDETRI